MLLYDYPRSSAAYRTRIALNLKGLAYERTTIDLLRDGGEQFRPEYRAVNLQARVPSLRLDDGTILVQSPAILEWLEETHPEPPLLPRDPAARARVRAVAAIIGCDIHPLNNLSVLSYLRGPLGQEKDAVRAWYHHWILEGFPAVEALIGASPFCFGATPTLADVYLVPQVANARRYHVPLDAFPKIVAAEAAAAALPAFAAARPEPATA